MGLRKTYRRTLRSIRRKLLGDNVELELGRIGDYKHFEAGYTTLFGKPFKFHHGPSFVEAYREIFQAEIYKFTPKKPGGIILDCGANMGLSVLYFALNYPSHQIIAFEPDPEIFKILEENVISQKLTNVKLFKKAVWTEITTLEFYTDGGMGGRVNNTYNGKQPTVIETVPLLDFITEEVEFLKMDIEGAETDVLQYCGTNLSKLNYVFFEYHNDVNKPQELHNLLNLFHDLGFHYYLKDSATRKSPFVDQDIICESFDMATNVFCYLPA